MSARSRRSRREETAQSAKATPDLTAREREVLDLLGRGETTRGIAGRLGISVKTVETHRAHIKDKLHLTTAAELRVYATRRRARD